MNVKGKYLKDESGSVISPVTSVDTVYGSNNTKLLDLFYPVGSYYETSNESFDPNVSWGGTWVNNDTAGYVTVAADIDGIGGMGSQKILHLDPGQTYGNKSINLEVNQLPPHTHTCNALIHWDDYGTHPGTGVALTTSSDAPWRIEMKNSEPTGSTKEVELIQPSIGVIRWHRTA